MVEAVQKAKEAVLGNYVFEPQANSSRMVRLPNSPSLSVDKVMGGAEYLLDNPEELGELEIESQLVSDEIDQQMLYRDSLETTGYWVTSGRGNSLILMDATGNVVVRTDGSRVEYSFEELTNKGYSRTESQAREQQNRFGIKGPASQNLPMGN